MKKKAIIIGAGPAGLTAAYELLKRTDVVPVIIEKDAQVGGISKTVEYKGNKMDFGPHRFFSKNDRVMNWWTSIFPLHTLSGQDLTISYQNKSRTLDTGAFKTTEAADGKPPARSMLVIPRLTRIYFLKQFFSYPIQLSMATLGQLGIITTIKIIFSYLYARLFPRKPENSLEDFMINKFGKTLYLLFFKDYTEKVWGVNCNNISAEWGAQRIKGVSLSKAVLHAAKALAKRKDAGLGQKNTETSLIEQFIYPAKGAGAIWEEVADQVVKGGGEIITSSTVKQVFYEGERITGITIVNTITARETKLEGDFFFSTMPVKELIAAIEGEVPVEVKQVADGLMYRDFVYAGVLVKKLQIPRPADSWIYIQEKNVKVARIQPYNNWGPYMVQDPDTIWLGMEYFCNKGDAIWEQSDEQIRSLAVQELIEMGWVLAEDVLDSTVNRMEKTYPAYFGTYNRFDVIRSYLDQFGNLFLVGRNGMHKYNNADHSMLTAMVAVDNIEAGLLTKENIWSINTEQEYHEEKQAAENKEAEPVPQVKEPQRSPVALSGFRGLVPVNPLDAKLFKFSVVVSLLMMVVYKILYPHTGFIDGDSYSYLSSAITNDFVNYYPIGYSKFLRLLSVFSSSDLLLFVIQYLLVQAGILFFVFSIFHFYKPGKAVKLFLLLYLLFNPVFLFISNYVSSDALFLSLSLVWFTLLIQILYTPYWRLILVQTFVLLLAFTVRYNALYYPFIGILVLFLVKTNWKIRLGGALVSIISIGAFVVFTTGAFKKITGVNQFTPFSGWQLANNAMNAYRFVDSVNRRPVPEKFKELDKIVTHYFDTTRDVIKHPWEIPYAHTAYMWKNGTPLRAYMAVKLGADSTKSEFVPWAKMAPLYKEYANFLIKEYPWAFVEHYLYPNTVKFYTPPGEFLYEYNAGVDTVRPIAQSWFKYKSRKVRGVLKSSQADFIGFMPVVTGVLNVLFLAGLLFNAMLDIYKGDVVEKKILFVASLLWLANFGFSVFASPITLRYQLFSVVVFTCFSVLLVGNVIVHSKARSI